MCYVCPAKTKKEVRGKKDHSFRHHAWGLNKQAMGPAFDKWPVSVLQKEAEITIGRNHATGISCCFIDVCKAVGVGHSKKKGTANCATEATGLTWQSIVYCSDPGSHPGRVHLNTASEGPNTF